jgi:hypothetical protein
MTSKYHAIDVANGQTLALIYVSHNPNDDSQIIATITPLLYLLDGGAKEKVLCNVTAVVFPFGTKDNYIARDLLSRIGVPKMDINTNIRYIKMVA